MLEKTNSLVVSEIVFMLVSNDDESYGYLDTFNNCRETGFVLKNSKNDICVWVYENRNSDSIVVAYGKMEDSDLNNMFSEEVYNDNRTFFGFSEYHKASQYVLELLKQAKRRNEEV